MTKSTTSQSNNNSGSDVRHTHPDDTHYRHIWMLEPQKAAGVLTQDGLTQIAEHKYKAGDYTYLDEVLNPMWTQLTEWLPMWMAPNLVTTLGGSCCLMSYLLTAYYNYSLQDEIPTWLMIFNGVAILTYYTLDCMDGKQARRTGSSSPLGQLFDHGMDCVSNISHLSAIQCIVLVHPVTFFWLQVTLQFTFFQAQWEEYYTGTLPHATGNIGVTEVNYSMGLWCLLTGLITGNQFYNTELTFLQDYGIRFPFQDIITAGKSTLLLKDVMAIGWVYMMSTLSFLSSIRVARQVGSPSRVASALSKLVCSPGLICFVALKYFKMDSSIRFQSLCLGYTICLITIKIIVLSMAKMAYASFQLDIFPFLAVVLYNHYTDTEDVERSYQLLAVWGLFRLLHWVIMAIQQLCKRLDIQLYKVKKRSTD